MADKLLRLTAPPPSDAAVIECLEDVLKQAREGRLESVAISYVLRGGSSQTQFVLGKGARWDALIGIASTVWFRIIQRADAELDG